MYMRVCIPYVVTILKIVLKLLCIYTKNYDYLTTDIDFHSYVSTEQASTDIITAISLLSLYTHQTNPM